MEIPGSANMWNARLETTSAVCAVHPRKADSPRILAFGLLIVVLVACALFASPSAAFATSIPMGFISWDVTVPGVLGQFDIANETGPNSSGDETAPVVTPVGLGNLALDVLLSNGGTTHFGSADFTLNPFDGLSFESTPLAIGGQNALPVQARLTGTFLTTAITLFDGSQMTILPDFLAIVSNGGQPLSDGDLAIIFADGQAVPPVTPGPAVPEPATLVLTALGLSAASLSRHGARLKRHLYARPVGRWVRTMIALAICVAVTSTASAQVRMNVSTQPSAGIAGTSTVNAIGSGFPMGHGSISAGDISVALTTTCGGPVVASTPASSTRVVVGSQYRVGFSVPPTLIAGTYFVALNGSTSEGTSFASAPDSCSEVHVTHSDPRLAACTQSSALSVYAPSSGGTVTAYAANGCWGCSGSTGLQAVVIEGNTSHTTIDTPSVVNTCATNPVTGKTVCLANNTDVYVIEGGAVTATLHSASSGLASQSGGSCNNCGVAIDAVNNRAVLSIGLAFTGANPFHSGLQFLDLNTNTFSTPIPARDGLSEAIVFDPFRAFILSPNSASNYALLSVGSDGAIGQFWNRVTPAVDLDGAAEDCSTGIAIGSNESTASVYLADLTQVALQPGTPGTWTAPQQSVTLADWGFNPTGISVAQGSHLGIIMPEGVNGRFAVIRLPDRSGTGTPTIVDHAVGAIPGFVGTRDPHPITAYTSPNDGKAYGVLASGVPPVALARVDLECVLALPRVAGQHTVNGSVSACLTVVQTGNAPLPPPTIISTPVTTATAGQRYRYKVIGRDETAFALTYSLPKAPAGMVIDTATGQIDWSPDITQAGVHNVTAAVQNLAGLTGEQSFQLTVSVVQNKPPVITSSAPTTGAVGQPYAYQVIATTPDNRPLTYVLLVAPSDMVVSSKSGLIQWTPAPNEIGFISATVLVQDLSGLSNSQSFQIHVPVPQNHPPVITSTAITSATVGQLYAYQLRATDPDDDPLAFSFVSAPVGMTIDAATGLIQWTPNNQAIGDWTVTVRAQDPSPLVGTQRFQVHVQRAYPVPTITIVSPDPGSILNKPVDVIATISDPSPGNPPVDWVVDLQRGDNRTRRIASGSGAISGTIARIDPTLLRDDSYALVITVSRSGQVDSQTFDYSVFSGNLKLGQFTTTFTDIAIPVAGIPMVISRVYDSLDVAAYEFGAGWRLELPGQVTDSARETPLEPFTQQTRVYITRPDGKRVGFTFAPTQPSPFLPVFVPGFAPDPGVKDTLAVDPDDLANTPGGFVSLLGGPYNPSRYYLTTKQGVRYTIDEGVGLEEIRDRNGNTLTVTPQGLVSSTGLSLPFERDSSGRITKITEPGGEFVTYAYDSGGNLVSSFDEMHHETKYFYDDQRFPHYLTRVEDPLGRPATRNVYNDEGRIVGECSATGDPTTLDGCFRFETNVADKAQTIVDARGDRSDLVFDTSGRVISEVRYRDTGTPLRTAFSYDVNGNLLTRTDPSGDVTTATYDAVGNVLSRTDPAGHATTYSYNNCNLVSRETDSAGIDTTYHYDQRCNRTAMAEPGGGTTTYAYDATGHIVRKTDPLGNTWTWVYDQRGNTQRATDPFGKAQEYAYDQNGRLTTRKDRNNRRVFYAYDAVGNILTEEWDDGYTALFSYDESSRITIALDSFSQLHFTYDEVGRITAVDNAGTPNAPAVVLAYTYDANGNVLTVQDSLGGKTQFGYDGLDRTISAIQSGQTVADKRFDVTYNSSGVVTNVSRSAGVTNTHDIADSTYSYQCASCSDLLTGILHRRSAGALIDNIELTRDIVGNVTTMHDVDGLHTYTYDVLRRLTSAIHTSGDKEIYLYDLVGNRVFSTNKGAATISYMAGGVGNRIVNDTDGSYQYDDEGNLTTETRLSTGEVVNYQYDHRNRLIKAVGSGSSEYAVDYVYDVFDRRIGAVWTGGGQWWAYDGQNPLLKFSRTGELTNRRFYGTGLDDIVAEQTGSMVSWYFGDVIGSTRHLITSGISSDVQISYDSFGLEKPRTGTSLTSKNDIWYAARERDEHTGNYHFRARSYIPGLGRFQQEDPIQPWGYSYAANNPLAFVDPFGLSETSEYNTVYWAVNEEGEVQYVGITNDLGRRSTEHAGRFAIREINPALNGLSRADARAVEQALIERYGLARNGGSLVNKINSIARTNPGYPAAMQRAWELLAGLGIF